MEEENKNVEATTEPIEVLGNTASMEPVVEQPVEPAPAAPVEAAPAEPVVIETPAEPAVEAPVVEPLAESTPVVEATPAVEPVAPVAETPVETAPVAPTEPTPAETPAAPAPVEPAVEPVAPAPEEPKKKGKGGLILIIILLLAVGGFAVWYFVLGGNGSKKEEPKTAPDQGEKKEEPKKELSDKEKLAAIKDEGTELDINSADVQKLYKLATNGDESKYEYIWSIKENDTLVASELSDEDKIKAIVHLIDENEYKEVECDGLEIPEKVGNLMNECVYAKENASKQKYLTKDYVLGLYTSLFGSNAKMNLELPIYLSANNLPLLKYVEKYDNFYLYVIDGGGMTSGLTEPVYKIKKAYSYDDFIIIDREITSKSVVDESSLDEDLKAKLQEELSKVSNVKYVFEKDGQSYRLLGIIDKTTK